METFGRYQIIERIAEGGMAEILLARSDELGGLNRLCALKRVKASYSSDVQFVSMFIDEARITIGLEHANIVRLFDFGHVDGAYFMAMEYVDGTDFSCLLTSTRRRGDILPAPAVAFIARQTAAALEYAHAIVDHEGRALRLVHRDVSPQNILLGSDGQVKLTDFGIAAARNKLTLTTPGTVLGKSAYMSPEQAMGEVVDARTDVWALGVILFEAVTGKRLFASENDVSTMQRVLDAPIPTPSVMRRNIPFRLDAIILKALQRDKDRRYADAGAMRRDLDDFLAEHPFGSDELARLVEATAWADQTFSMRPPSMDLVPNVTDPSRASLDTALDGVSLKDDAEVKQLSELLEAEPSLWTLVALGDRFAHLGSRAEALGAFRAAAAAFAYRGQLVQTIGAFAGARSLLDPTELAHDLLVLGDIEAGKAVELENAVARLSCRPFFELIRRGLVDVHLDPHARKPTPLFGYLAPREFARLAAAVKTRTLKVGAVAIAEDDKGDSLFAIARGRCVVYCRPPSDDEAAPAATVDIAEVTRPSAVRRARAPSRIYLSGLADGDFFGEFSFLTGRPRSATVEAITECRVLEISQELADELFAADPAFSEPLLRFYKERVVELMMAKSEAFSMLRPRDRKELLERAEIVHFQDTDLILEEGQIPGALYFIKSGEVEVFRRDNGLPIFINKLQQGEFFGEIGAITGERRTLSVAAMGDTTVFRIDRKWLLEIVDREPALRRMFDETIRVRTAETRERIDEHRRIFYGT
jgi:serine/threonine protein kinase/CRP-like cAMP-binding protein